MLQAQEQTINSLFTYDKSVSATDTFSAVLGLTLNQSDVVKVYASGTGLSFNMFGVETS